MSTPSFATSISAAAVSRRPNQTAVVTPLNYTTLPLNASPNAHYLLPGSNMSANAHAWTPSSSSHNLGGTPNLLGRAPSVALSQLSAVSPASPARFMLGGKTNPAQLNGDVNSKSLQAGGKIVLDDAERKRRLDQVLTLLGDRPGSVGREGLERLARRFGMDALWEEGREGDGAGTLSLAGGVMVCEVELRSATTSLSPVSRVALSFPGSSDAVASTAIAATNVLWRNLMPPPSPAPTASRHAVVHTQVSQQPCAATTLSAFEANLRRLADMDKLSGPGANCFEAVTGVYTALRRLFDHEKNMIRHVDPDAADRTKVAGLVSDTGPISDEESELEVMCASSGRPRMHVGGTVGLSLEYWLCERLVRQRSASGEMRSMQTQGSALDTTSDEVDDRQNRPDAQDNDIFRLVIETEHSVPTLYPPMRITDDWLSISSTSAATSLDATMSPIQPENTTTASSRVIWHDPPPLRPPAEPSTTQSARFVAILSPALIVPTHIAAQIFASLGISSIPHGDSAPASYTSLVLRTPVPAAMPRVTRDLPIPSSPTVDSSTKAATSNLSTSMHCTISLHTPAGGPCPSTVLTRLPFTHPRQLVALLPLLRQWAACQALLRHSFDNKAGDEGGTVGNMGNEFPGPSEDDEDSEDDQDDEAMLDALLAPIPALKMTPSSPSSPRQTARRRLRKRPSECAVDVTFHPLHTVAPRFTIVVSSSSSAVRTTAKNGLVRAAFSVELNGAIKLVATDGFTRGSATVESDERTDSRGIARAQNVTMMTTTTTMAATKAGQVSEALAGTLAVCEDFGTWAVWVEQRCQQEI